MKDLFVIGIILINLNLVILLTVLAESTEEIQNTVTPQIVDNVENNNEFIACILGSEFDVLTDYQIEKLTLPICEEMVVSTEDLATEAFNQNSITETDGNQYECIPLLELDEITASERASFDDVPLCDEIDLEESKEPIKA